MQYGATLNPMKSIEKTYSIDIAVVVTSIGPRAYEVSRERLEAYSKLTKEQRLKWVEESAAFLRLAKVSLETNK